MNTWRQMEKPVDEGKNRFIGMSNMTIPKLEAVLPLCYIKPVAIEMELHPSFQQPELVEIAKAHNVHPAIICIKWAVQRGQTPIPFSIHESEYVSNLRAVTEDPLTEEEMKIMTTLDRNCRFIKGHVFLWEGAEDWYDLWNVNGEITK